MNRTELLSEIYTGRAHLEADLARMAPARMIEPDLPGGWSPKDMLAHIGWWEQRCVEIYHELASGQTPSNPVDGTGVDQVNARILEQFRARSLEDVRAFEQDAYHRVLDLVETAPEADLFAPQRFAWTEGQPFSEWVLGNSCGHYEEHLVDLERLLAGAGQ